MIKRQHYGGIDLNKTFIYNYSVSQSVLKPIKSAYNKACDMMENKAFLHHYSRFGIGEEEMSESIMDVAQIITNYESLSL